ncbi:hypothetical protein, conserved in T.vivax [Trypanosoma vivax Y486]|uniref:Uncharacterized protein n=1 Tax=Trypanosoma vivax (strain Y486) TaxID=1055687 RepID=F9WRY1_TRYVY|nr:hypothetical protein, conserved in T.vivax [Trypanosoma vivax Y486]|eukprot:CCD20317.1 hypothetical protein, conserved in T.vivax [Trypanosoma vivax Y486]
MRNTEILLACVVALAIGWRQCADATAAVKGANMPLISIVCNLVQIAEVVTRDALVEKGTEFFAALNAAMGIGRDDAPWQWALNLGNARLARLAQAAIGNWSAEEKITKDKAEDVCSTQADTRACAAIKAFNEYNTQRAKSAGDADAAIAPDADKQEAAWSTTGQEESRKPAASKKLCLAGTAVYLCTGASSGNPCTVGGANPSGSAITSGSQSSASGVKGLWDKLNPAVCHAPTEDRTFHNGEDEHDIALFRNSLQDRGKQQTPENTHSATAPTSTRPQTQVASATQVTWHLAKRTPRGWTTSAPQQKHSELHCQHTASQKSTSTKSSRQSTGCKTRTHTELTQTKKHETLSAPRTQHSAKAEKVQAPQPGKEARAQAKTQTRTQ